LPASTAACSNELPPLGEVVVVVDTDLRVPDFAGRLRVDLYSEEGAWYASRDMAVRNPSDWPASFGIVAPAGVERRVLVRLRAYPEGRVRDYRGERFNRPDPYVPPVAPQSLSELCAAPPVLPLGGTVTVRRDREPFIGQLTGGVDCAKYDTILGSAAAVVEVAQPGRYHFGVIDSYPREFHVSLQLRQTCDDDSTALGCHSGVDEINVASVKWDYSVPELDLDLEPGTYYLVTGGSVIAEAPTDIVLGAAPSGAWPPSSPPAEALPADPQPASPDIDATEEPQPSVTVDRLVLVRIVPDAVLSTQVTLRGACLGTMSQLESEWPYQHPRMGEASTCTSTPGTREPLREATLEPHPITTSSVQGTYPEAEPCPPGTEGSERVCVPGGLFLLGSTLNASGDETDPLPERAAFLRSFWIDKHEVTVRRWREARNAGFNPGLDRPLWWEDEMPGHINPQFQQYDIAFCTWSETNRGREDMPLNCISWYGARAMCQFVGGDLPTEAQWEYVATAAGRRYETWWPWGADEPGCIDDLLAAHRVVTGRSDLGLAGTSSGLCHQANPLAVGPISVFDSDGLTGDVTPPLDGVNPVVGLVGSVREWARDGFRPFGHPCWEGAGLVDPECVEEDAPNRVMRGGNWFMNTSEAWITRRQPTTPVTQLPLTGFRCVYTGPEGS
jgi:formylglycine-generating enzyme required for sulfatase activity